MLPVIMLQYPLDVLVWIHTCIRVVSEIVLNRGK
jgi:hypothetical protein